jgi:hypothetical protein
VYKIYILIATGAVREVGNQKEQHDKICHAEAAGACSRTGQKHHSMMISAMLKLLSLPAGSSLIEKFEAASGSLTAGSSKHSQCPCAYIKGTHARDLTPLFFCINQV